MIYWICYVGSLPFLRGTGTSFSKCITERMMRMSKPFNPSEWTRIENLERGHRMYINNHIQLHKTRISFTLEQQRLLDEYYAALQEVKIYDKNLNREQE